MKATKPRHLATITRRCFIAIALPNEVKQSLARAQSRLRHADFKVSFVPPANMHLTLSFLGDVLLSRIHDVAGAVDTAVLGHAPFAVKAAQLGYFGKRGSPRAIWSHISHDSEALIALQTSLAKALSLNGFPTEDRRFRPHLTIARIRIPKRNLPLVEHLEHDAHQEFGMIPVTHLHLIQSILQPTGVEYAILHTAPLG